MPFLPVYDPATRPCALSNRPGAIALRDGVLEAMREPWGIYNLGILSCRDIAGSNPPEPSIHGNGRAWDAGVRSRIGGDHLAAVLVEHHLELGVQGVIWWHEAWSTVTPRWHAYNGADPHTGHLHIELTREAGERLTIAEVRAVLEPHHQEDDEMPYKLLQGDHSVKLYMVTPAGLVHVSNPESLSLLRAAGIASPAPPVVVPQVQITTWLAAP